METRISINDRLIADALHVTGLTAVDDVIRMGLIVLIKMRLANQKQIKQFRGAFAWNPEPMFSPGSKQVNAAR